MWLGAGAVVAGVIGAAFAMLPPVPAEAEAPSRPPVDFTESVHWMTAAEAFFDENGAPPWPLDAEVRPQPDLASSVAAAEEQWARIAQSLPDLVRPETQFASWTTRLALDTDLGRCYQEAGLEVTESIGRDGVVDGLEFRDRTGRPETIAAAYACGFLEHPGVPFEYEAAAEWEWRYYGEVVSPCLEAHGVRQRPLPAFELHLELLVIYGIGWEPTLPTENVDRIVATCRPFG